MKITSFDDIEKTDDDLASLFLRPDEAVNWIYAVEHGIKDWIAENNKQHWEIVRYVSEQRGILGKLKKDKKTAMLTREDFASVLLKFCPNAFKEGETISALKSSMEHYQFATIWKELDKMPDGHIVRPLIKTVENLLDQKPIIESHEEEKKPTLEDLVEKYLRLNVDEQRNRFPLSKVCIRPQYNDVCPAISVETYKSEKFLNDHRPSHIDAYEFIDGELLINKLYEFIGQYYDKGVKLYIVSSSGLRPNVRALAKDNGIGYVRLNPNSEMTSECYELERTIEDYTKQRHYLDILAGTKPMTTPILIMDGSMLTSSMADVLSEHGVAVKKHRLLNIPYLPDDEIEKRANELTEEGVKERILMFKRLSSLNIDPSIDPLDYADLSIDPFEYAASNGLSYKVEYIEEEFQLGILNIEKNYVILNSKGLNNYKRYRFTMAHELGHYILHSHLFKEQGIVSVGESEETLSISINDSRRIEYQANLFASYLLMPMALVATIYEHLFETIIHKDYGDTLRPLYYNPMQPETFESYNNVVGSMAKLLGVSLQAMNIRLQSLGLLNMPKWQ